MWPRAKHASARPAIPNRDGDVAHWRRDYLVRAGFEADLANLIATDCAIDLHALIALVERGCPPTLAARILAPLDHERKPC